MSFLSSVCRINNLNNDFWHRIFTSLPFAPQNNEQVKNIAYFINILTISILALNIAISNNVFFGILTCIFLAFSNSSGIFFLKNFDKDFEYKCLSVLSLLPTATIFLVIASFVFGSFELNLIESLSLLLQIFVNFALPMNRHNFVKIMSAKK